MKRYKLVQVGTRPTLLFSEKSHAIQAWMESPENDYQAPELYAWSWASGHMVIDRQWPVCDRTYKVVDGGWIRIS